MLVYVAVFDPLPAYRRGIMAALTEVQLESEAPDDLIAWISLAFTAAALIASLKKL